MKVLPDCSGCRALARPPLARCCRPVRGGAYGRRRRASHSVVEPIPYGRPAAGRVRAPVGRPPAGDGTARVRRYVRRRVERRDRRVRAADRRRDRGSATYSTLIDPSVVAPRRRWRLPAQGSCGASADGRSSACPRRTSAATRRRGDGSADAVEPGARARRCVRAHVRAPRPTLRRDAAVPRARGAPHDNAVAGRASSGPPGAAGGGDDDEAVDATSASADNTLPRPAQAGPRRCAAVYRLDAAQGFVSTDGGAACGAPAIARGDVRPAVGGVTLARARSEPQPVRTDDRRSCRPRPEPAFVSPRGSGRLRRRVSSGRHTTSSSSIAFSPVAAAT